MSVLWDLHQLDLTCMHALVSLGTYNYSLSVECFTILCRLCQTKIQIHNTLVYLYLYCIVVKVVFFFRFVELVRDLQVRLNRHVWVRARVLDHLNHHAYMRANKFYKCGIVKISVKLNATYCK